MKLEIEIEDIAFADLKRTANGKEPAEFAKFLVLREIAAFRLREDTAAFQQQRSREIMKALGMEE